MNNPEDKSPSSFGHGGNLAELASQAGCPPERLIDFSANINPLGPPEYLRQVISRNLAGLINYPDPHCRELTAALAGELGVGPGQIIIANGSTELIYALARTLPCERAVIPVPSYLDYEKAARLARLQVKKVPLREADDFRLDFAELAHHLQEGDLVYLGRPNNPTGAAFAAEPLQELVAAHPETFFAVDESFFAFIDGSSALVTADMPANLIVIRSLTKFYAIPGLRLGYAVASPVIAGMLRQQVLPWSVNHLAQAAGKAMVGDHEYNESSRRFVRQRRLELFAGLAELPALKVFPGEANYLLVKLEEKGLTARQLAERLLQNDPQTPIAIRVCANFSGLDESYFRVAVRDDAENTKLCLALARELGSGIVSTGQVKKKTPALMLQGTSSDAGKSVLAAAFCRIFLQDGYRVAPFKAQNMSLNSFVTRNGEEMGRAQVVQAQACRLDPDVRMNPVLLKPSSDVGCQVIVNGFPVGNMRADNYIDYKGEAAAAARAAYDSLAAEHDLMVLEGAGSPAEVNLKQHDIVNMGMARYAGAEVLLVGDIDRGGIFASFIGTMEVMAEWERQRIAGFIVNRFRGMESLLDDAFRYTEEFTGKPVLGTVPMIKDLGLPEEDSVSYKAGSFTRAAPVGEHVVIGVIDLPHISNFTDLEPFLAEPDVHLKIIRSAAELDAAADDLAALILPGSKNVISDLGVLRQNGIAARISELARQGNLDLVGICGGFQMLGRQINDPHRIESAGGEVEGLGLLAMTTTLAAEKTLIRQSGNYLPARLKVHGYEIHHGRTTSTLGPALQLASGANDGAVSADGRIWGSYLHGIFDDDDFRRWFIDMLRSSRNLQPLGRVAAPYDLEPALDRLADIVRRSVDLERIYRILGLR